MGKFDTGGFSPQQQNKQRYQKGVFDERINTAKKWSRWIAEIIFYPEYTVGKKRHGHIIVKFRPYFSEETGILHTYSPALMLNKDEDYFWDLVSGGKTGSVGATYLEESRKRTNAIRKAIGAKPKHQRLTNSKGSQILSYNKDSGAKYHYLSNNKVALIKTQRNSASILKSKKLK